MPRIVLIALIFICFVSLPSVAAETSEQAYQKARDSYYSLQDSSRKQMYRENWDRVISQIKGVHERFPNTKRGADAYYMCGKSTAGLYAISRIAKDAEEAVKFYELMAAIYPQSSLADDALFQAGKILEENLADPERAYLAYQRLVERIPDGDMFGKAKARLVALAEHKPKPAAPVVVIEPASRSDKKGAVDKPERVDKQLSDSRLTAIRYWSNPGYTRIVLDVSTEAEFSAHYLAPEVANNVPPRIYVDIEKTALDEELKDPKIVDDGLLRQIRTGLPQPDTVRVVLDLDSIGDYKVFPLSDPCRIVIDISGDKAAELKHREPELRALPKSDNDAIAKVLNDAPKSQPSLHIPAAPASPLLRRIVVDAGHGGKDPGAVGPSKVLEKDVTLKLAKQLAKELRSLLHCEVILTRSDDVYLPLEERTAIANKVDADLFISLHANANKNRNAYGIETYYLNFSKNDKAAAVAARENGTSLKQVSDLELILFDLMANSKINESSRLATEIQKTLVQQVSRKYSDVRDLGVRQGPFYVLLGATMPSVLVETAFLSNPREEKRLISKDYQVSTAQAIALAVKNYAISNKLIAAR